MMIATLILSAAFVTPQGPTTSGPFMNVPTVLRKAGEKELYVAGPAGEPARKALNYDPNYSLERLLGTSDLELTSFSMGRAFITLEVKWHSSWGEYRACADLRNNAWSFLLYSLSPSSTGQSGSIYRESPGTVGGDVFSRILEGSEDHIPAEYVGVIQRARVGTEMGVSNTIGLDSYGYAQLTNPQVEGYGEFFFTLDADSLDHDDVENVWLIPPGSRTTATIFRTYWVEGTPGHWAVPAVYRLPAQLGLQSTDQIDALTVDTGNNVILLSLTRIDDDLGRQLWLVGPSIIGPYYTSSGEDLYADAYLKLNAATDDVDAFCGDDPLLPEVGEVGSRHDFRRTLTAAFFPGLGEAGVNCAAHRVSFKNKGQFDRHYFYLNLSGLMSTESSLATLWSYLDNTTGSIKVAEFAVRGGGKVVYKRPWPIPDTNGSPFIEPTYYWTVRTRSTTQTSRHFQFFR